MLEKLLTNLLYNVDTKKTPKKPAVRSTASSVAMFEQGQGLEQKLVKILSHSAIINTGRVQLLGLDKIKRKIGDKWPDLRENILSTLHQIVDQRISDEDAYFSKNDEEHIIVFAHLSEDRARLVCAKILQELTMRYLGNQDTRDIVVRTATGAIDGVLKFKAVTLEELLDAIPMVETSALPAEQQQGSINHGAKLRSAEQLGNFFQDAKGRLSKVIEPVFMPLWDAQHEVISNYGLNFRLKAKTSLSGNYEDLVRNFRKREKVIIEYILADECKEILEEFYLNKFRAVFCLPVSYETVFNPDLMAAYLKVLAKIPENLRRYVTITLMEFPAGIPEGKFRFITSSLRRYCSNIILHCRDYLPHDITFYKECGVSCISIALSDSQRMKESYWKTLSQMVEKCHKNKLRASVINLHSSDELVLAKEALFDFMAGEAICKNTETPGHNGAYKLERALVWPASDFLRPVAIVEEGR